MKISTKMIDLIQHKILDNKIKMVPFDQLDKDLTAYENHALLVGGILSLNCRNRSETASERFSSRENILGGAKIATKNVRLFPIFFAKKIYRISKHSIFFVEFPIFDFFLKIENVFLH